MTKGYVSNWSEEVLVFEKVTVLWKYVFSDLKDEEILGTFFQKIKAKSKSKRV